MLKVFEHYMDIGPSDWKWSPQFLPKELRCRGTQKLIFNTNSMDKLLALRVDADFPFFISSAGRDPDHNDKVSSTGLTGPHTTGQAFDIKCYGDRAFWIVSNAMRHGFTGIGVSQKGPHSSRFIHLDDIQTGPRPTVWSY